MNRETWTRLRPILERLLELDADRHEAFLDEVCGGDESLRRAALQAVRREHEERDFLRPPSTTTETSTPPPTCGDRLGRWVLEEKIGEGGMGTVWSVSRDDGAFTMRAAAKLLRTGPLSEPMRRRFHAEREILARLEHPNIARLLDGGEAEHGVPYLVMERVEGLHIDRYCAEGDLSVRERIELFVVMCEAVGHAHRNMIVHRDLKPANVLVDGNGRPKLLDFGVARMVGPDDGADVTVTGSVALTPQYASPEQVRGEPVTTASDVYSLGLMLYELVSGKRPYDLGDTNLADLVKTVCEARPAPPSRTADARLRPEIDDDLDLVVATALAKEPLARYGSAEALAADLSRVLRDEPIAARPASVGYLLRMFARRNRSLVSAAALVFLIAIAAAAVSLRFAWDANRERAAAVEERTRADTLFSTLLEHSLDATFGFALRIHDLPGATQVGADMIAQAVDELELLAAQAGSDDGVRIELARAYIRLGDVQGNPSHPNLGDSSGAEHSYRQALSLAESIAPSPRTSRVLSKSRKCLGDMAMVRGEHETAIEEYRRAVSALQPTEADVVTRRELALAHDALAMALSTAGEDGAEQHAQRYLALIAELANTQPEDRFLQLHSALARQRLAAIAFRNSDYAGALERYREAAPILEGLAEAEPNAGTTRQKTAWNRMWVGTCEVLLGRAEDGAKSLARAAEAYEMLAANDPENRQYDAWLGNVYDMLGNISKDDAGAARVGSEERASHWKSACELYTHALERFVAAAAREPRYRGLPDVLREKIAACEEALRAD